ncbi:hydroxymethylbilane synthase [Blastochloris sulfoviridis]|uniref:Porphobilinogen deaminase n=1 Tax=Blastochloris sulfoviridis TaxID=50712 RepID=A0A5M6I4Y8_9HYPH|nr:hydroxymethylbilane synthase [Blastochloris sulfoviridis]KAA5603290.1 hydroxymethylbilane synthase [Blastochloris sulfoviridis]
MTQSSPFLRLGTRGSALALAQAYETRRRLAAAHGVPEDDIRIDIIKVIGDQILDRALSQAGGKGLFTKEIEDAMLAGQIDIAVHSSKDLPTVLPPGLMLPAFLPREDVRDVLISRVPGGLAGLPQDGKVGSASLRRQAMVKRTRPDLDVSLLRGNVETRLRKVAEGAVDATLLALAGLKRLGLIDRLPAGVTATIIEADDFIPAVGQGAIAIECREDDSRTRELMAAINAPATERALAAERAFLHELDGSCRTPIGGHATVTGDRLSFAGIILMPDGTEAHDTTREGSVTEAAALGADAGRELRGRAGPAFFAALAGA